MTLKVGESYRAVWDGVPDWLRIVKIEVLPNGKAWVYFKIMDRTAPRWLEWLPWSSDYQPVEQFVDRMDRAKRMDDEEPKLKKIRSVPEIEVKYR